MVVLIRRIERTRRKAWRQSIESGMVSSGR